MKLFSYRWSGGDVSIVYAKDREHAWKILDALAAVDIERITPIHERDFFITFAANPNGRPDVGNLLRLSDNQGVGFVGWQVHLADLPAVEDEYAAQLVKEFQLTLPKLKNSLKRKWRAQHRAIHKFYAADQGDEVYQRQEAEMFARIDALTDADLARGREDIARELAGTAHAAELARLSEAKPSAKRAAASRRNGKLGSRPRKTVDPRRAWAGIHVVKEGPR
jgi:hypothetical protein